MICCGTNNPAILRSYLEKREFALVVDSKDFSESTLMGEHLISRYDITEFYRSPRRQYRLFCGDRLGKPGGTLIKRRVISPAVTASR